MLFFVCCLLASTEANGAIGSPDFPSEPKNIQCPSMTCTPERCSSGGSFNVTDNFSKLKACDCHPGCYTYGTCCDNYEQVCSPPMADNGIDVYQMRSDLNVVSCEPIFVESGKKLLYLLMVTQCPKPLDGHFSVENVALCEERGTRLDQDMLISHGSLFYRNIHCLRCNGGAIGDGESVPAKFVCDTRGMSLVHIKSLNESGMLELLADETCNLSYDVDHFSPDNVCYHNYIDKCDRKFKKTLSNYEQVNEACQSYSSYVVPNSTISFKFVPLYKNPYCALCNTHNYLDVYCIDPNETAFQSFKDVSRSTCPFCTYRGTFSLLLDFSGRIVSRSTILGKCRHGSNYTSSFINIETNKCMAKLCPSEYRLLNGSMCIRDEGYSFKTLHPELSFEFQNNYGIKLMIYYENELGFDYVQRQVHVVFGGSMRITFVSESIHDCTPSNMVPSLLCIEVTFTGHYFIEDLTVFTSVEFYDILNGIDNDLSIVQLQIHLPANNVCDGNCSLYHTSDFILTTNDVEEHDIIVSETDVKDGKLNSLLAYLPEFDSILSLQQLYFDISISRSAAGHWTAERRLGVHIVPHFNCSREGACVPLSLPPERALTERGLKIEAILTKCCNVISVIALFLSLISRSFGPTATFPIVIQICIQVSLLFAHLIFLLSSSFSFPHVLCVASSSLQHFFWIASFVFMNVLSQILYKTFKSLSARVDEEWSAKIAYLGLGWGIPLLIACICCVLHFLGYFNYAEHGVCWIRGQLNLIIAFGLPVGALIVVNIALFVLTALRLREATSAVSRNASPTVCSFRFRFYLHLRLFSIMGSTWIFGYLSNIAHLRALSYLFVSLASLNGFFISLAFSLTKSNIQIIRTRFSAIFTNSRPTSLEQDDTKIPAVVSRDVATAQTAQSFVGPIID